MTLLPSVLVTTPLPPSSLSLLQSLHGHSISLYYLPSNLSPILPTVNAIITSNSTPLPSSTLSLCPLLKVISSISPSFDNINLSTCSDLKIRVLSTNHLATDSTAELAIGLLISLSRNFFTPSSPLLGSQISSKTIGIIGLGKIGVAVADRLAPFKPANILYSNPRSKPDAARATRAEFVPFKSLISSSDIIIITCTLSDTTTNLFNSTVFSIMKKHSILINIARGQIVNHDHLAEALRKGQTIASAGLDVTHPDPLPPSHPLISDPVINKKVIILPNLASATIQTREAMGKLAIQQIMEHLNSLM